MRSRSRDELLSSTAIPLSWAGEFDWWHTIAELRAYGMSWSEIEADLMGGRQVLWEKTDG